MQIQLSSACSKVDIESLTKIEDPRGQQSKHNRASYAKPDGNLRSSSNCQSSRSYFSNEMAPLHILLYLAPVSLSSKVFPYDVISI